MPLHEVALLDRSGDWPGALTAPGPPKGSRTSSEKPSNLEIRRDLCLLRPPQDFPLPHLRGTSRKVSISQAAAGGEGGGLLATGRWLPRHVQGSIPGVPLTPGDHRMFVIGTLRDL